MRYVLAVSLVSLIALGACDNKDKPAETQAVADAPVSAAERAANVTARGTMTTDIVIGSEKAPVEIIEYASLTCPHCAKMSEESITPLMESYVATGKVRYVFRHFLLNGVDMTASKIARCAGPAGYYGMMDLFFKKQTYWADETYLEKLTGLARKAGLSKSQLDACLADPALQAYLIKSTEDGAKEWNITGTPTLIINGEVQKSGEITYADLQQLIQSKM